MDMMRRKILLAPVALALLLAGCAVPQESQESPPAEDLTVVTPDDIDWGEAPESLPPGSRVAVLTGDPTAEGRWTMRVEVPAGAQIDPHTHPDPEHVTVISGTAHLAMGETTDRDGATELPPGSFFQIPPDTPHFFFAGDDEPVVVQLSGEGPWSLEHVEDEDVAPAE